MTRVLLTGVGGFVGSHCLEHILENTSWSVAAPVTFRHRGKADRIAEVLGRRPDWPERVTVISHDLTAAFSDQALARIGNVDYVIAMASESHVDRSITEPVPFIRNNVDVILSTLEFCRQAKPRAVIVVSTDEVYGPLASGHDARYGTRGHPEWAPILPSNPYSASKAAQEAIAISYWRTYGVPVILVNCMNMIGERQDAEKFLPMLIKMISARQTVPIHGREGDIGTRHYLHARNLADGILWLLKDRAPVMYQAHAVATEFAPAWIAERPDRWNVVGPDRISNLELAEMVAAILGRQLRYELVDFHSARPGHDPHYGLDPAKLTSAGWKPPVPFTESLARTVRWSMRNPEWLL